MEQKEREKADLPVRRHCFLRDASSPELSTKFTAESCEWIQGWLSNWLQSRAANPGAQEGEHQEVTVRKEEDNEKNEGKQMLEVLGEEPARVFCCDLERMPCKLKAGEIHRAAGEALRLSCTQESLNIPSISHRARGSCTAQHSTHPAEARPQEWCFGTASSCVSGSI